MHLLYLVNILILPILTDPIPPNVPVRTCVKSRKSDEHHEYTYRKHEIQYEMNETEMRDAW
jgi:hypothetical protein